MLFLLLEKRLKRIKAPATTSSSRYVARSMLSSLEATRQDHMTHFMNQDSGSAQAGGAVVASYNPQEERLRMPDEAELPDESHRALGCCQCCFPLYKLLFPERVSVSKTERCRLVDCDELQLQHEPDGDIGDGSSTAIR